MSHPSTASLSTAGASQTPTPAASSPAPTSAAAPRLSADGEPILCGHCGRTATNGISCEGYCVADSGY